MTFNSNTSQVSKFNNFSTALSVSYRTIKASVVMLGDDGLYWVVNMGLGAWLERNGYEVAN